MIPLLRTTETEAAAAPGTADEPPFENTLAPVQGLIVAVALSVPLWAVIGGIVWAVL